MVCEHIHLCSVPKHLVFNKGEYRIWECNKCGLRFARPEKDMQEHIENVYDDAYFFGGEDGYSDYFQEKDLLIKHGEYYAKKIRPWSSTGSLLDVGSAAGFLMKGFENEGWEVTGIEPNNTMRSYAKKELNLNIIEGNFETFNSDKQYDLLCLIQVIGHLYDFDAAMKKINTSTKKGGLVLVESWNMKSLIAQVLGKNWHEYSPPSVLNWFSKSSLRNIFRSYGFKELQNGLPQKKISLQHALTLFEHKYPKLSNGTKVIENLIQKKQIILPYPPLDIFWMLFQKTG